MACEALLCAGYRVRVLDCLLHGGAPLLGLFRPGFTFMNGDVRDAATVERALDGVDAIVHLAAIVGDPACAQQTDLAWQTNYKAAIQVYKLAKDMGVRQMVFASTCSNYGKMEDPSSYVNEDSVLAPVSLYAETKVAVERELLSANGGSGPVVTILRFATIFGISPRMRFDLTVNEFAMELVTKRKLVVYGEQFWRPYVHVRDAALAIQLVLSADNEKAVGRVFNVGDTQENYRKKDIVDLVRAQISGDVEIESVHKQEDPRDYRVSFQRINQEMGFGITTTVAEGITEVLAAIAQGIFPNPDDRYYRNS